LYNFDEDVISTSTELFLNNESTLNFLLEKMQKGELFFTVLSNRLILNVERERCIVYLSKNIEKALYQKLSLIARSEMVLIFMDDKLPSLDVKCFKQKQDSNHFFIQNNELEVLFDLLLKGGAENFDVSLVSFNQFRISKKNQPSVFVDVHFSLDFEFFIKVLNQIQNKSDIDKLINILNESDVGFFLDIPNMQFDMDPNTWLVVFDSEESILKIIKNPNKDLSTLFDLFLDCVRFSDDHTFFEKRKLFQSELERVANEIQNVAFLDSFRDFLIARNDPNLEIKLKVLEEIKGLIYGLNFSIKNFGEQIQGLKSDSKGVQYSLSEIYSENVDYVLSLLAKNAEEVEKIYSPDGEKVFLFYYRMGHLRFTQLNNDTSRELLEKYGRTFKGVFKKVNKESGESFYLLDSKSVLYSLLNNKMEGVTFVKYFENSNEILLKLGEQELRFVLSEDSFNDFNEYHNKINQFYRD
jgi:pantothenate kinase